MGDETSALEIKEPKSKVQEYTGKITDNPAPSDEKYEEPVFAKEPPGSEIFGDNANPLNADNRDLHELHIRSTNDQIDSQSISSRQNSLERPAAGAGGSSTNPPAASRGRRHVRKTIFENECSNEYGLAIGPAAGLGPQIEIPNDNQEIFSIKGTRSIKINRHRDTVNVFPSGCMGIPQDALPKIPEDAAAAAAAAFPLIDLSGTPDGSPKKDEDCSSVEVTPRLMDTPRDEPYAMPTSPKKNSDGEESPVLTPRSITQNCSHNSVQYRRSRPLSAVQRNPLTGVGYEDRDFIRQNTMKKRDGNPVLGQGYETKDINNKSKKIPPGGYSRGLW